MAELVKSKSGFLYQEPFGFAHAMWQKDPVTSDKICVNPASFELLPGDNIVRYMTETPAKEFVMQVHFVHQPLAYDSFAGVVVFADKDAYMECTTYRDPSTEAGLVVNYYSYIKVLKKDYRYTFYGSIDGKSWILVGSQLSRGSLIGFFLRCTNKSERSIKIDSVLFTSSNFVTVSGIKGYYRVELYNDIGVLIFEKDLEYNATQLDIDTTNLTMPLVNYRLKVINPEMRPVYDELVTLYGGDVFEFNESNKRVFLDRTDNYIGLELNNSTNVEFDLGRIQGEYLLHTLTIVVPEGEAVYDTDVYIKPYLYNSHVTDLVYLGLCDSPDDTEEEIVEWSKKVRIPKVTNLAPAKIYMKVYKDYTDVMLFDTTRYKFKVIVE